MSLTVLVSQKSMSTLKVYAGRDENYLAVAIKEIKEQNMADVQPLHDEIRLHSKFKHQNIVQYRGSVFEDGVFKIVMEHVSIIFHCIYREAFVTPLALEGPHKWNFNR